MEFKEPKTKQKRLLTVNEMLFLLKIELIIKEVKQLNQN